MEMLAASRDPTRALTCVCVNETYPRRGRLSGHPSRDGGVQLQWTGAGHEDFVAAQQVDVEQEQLPSRYIDCSLRDLRSYAVCTRKTMHAPETPVGGVWEGSRLSNLPEWTPRNRHVGENKQYVELRYSTVPMFYFMRLFLPIESVPTVWDENNWH